MSDSIPAAPFPADSPLAAASLSSAVVPPPPVALTPAVGTPPASALSPAVVPSPPAALTPVVGTPPASALSPPAAPLAPAPGACPSSAPAPRTLLDVFYDTVSRAGQRVAIDAVDRTLTYGQLAAASSELARKLTGSGVGPGDRVAVRVASGTAELYVAILGVLHAGAAYVPIDADDPPARAEDLMRRAGACAVVGDELTITHLAPAGGTIAAPGPADDAWVIFTSGSTGTPKAVAVSHRAAAAFVDAEAELLHVHERDRVLAGLSVAFDASCEEMWLAWRNGAALVPAPRALVRAGVQLGPWLAGRGVSVVSTVPTLAAMWEEGDLAAVRLLILGGEACPDSLAQRLCRSREVWNTYGPTEATVVSTAARLEDGRAVTIGWPLRGWEVAVLDEQGRPVPIGESGELAIAGVGLGRYLDDGLDAERFAPVPALGWERAYRTGDMVCETIDGLRFLGRRDDQVKIGGRRIELGEIDACLAAAPGVSAAISAIRESESGNRLLVGYMVGDAEPAAVRAWLGERLPDGLVPLIVSLPALPRSRSGKVDRKALPWPPPAPEAVSGGELDGELDGEAAWLAERWREQLGPLPIGAESDFFALGGSSLSAAKLVSALRERYPSVAVADIYNHRTLAAMSARLQDLAPRRAQARSQRPALSRGFQALHLGGLLILLLSAAPTWVFGTLLLDRIYPGGIGPQVGWAWIILGWLALGSRPARAIIVALARRLLLGRRLRPGRHPRHSLLTWRIWLLERLSEAFQLEGLAGTPWAARYARIVGHDVAAGARLGTLPSPASLVSIGAGATLEDDVDMSGWWIDGETLVIEPVRIGAGARVGARSLLMPGARIGEGAEVEPGSVVRGEIPAGERWAGSPARRVGVAGERWPAQEPPPAPHRSAWKLAYVFGETLEGLIALIAVVPGLALLILLRTPGQSIGALVTLAITIAPVMVVSFVVVYALLVALLVRSVSPLIRPGLHPAGGSVGWALWFTETVMAGTRDTLFPLYSSMFTAPWLRLAGIEIGARSELCTAVGLNRLVSFGQRSFAADDVVFATARARDGWLSVAPIEVGEESFLGNGAILQGGSSTGRRSIVGVLTTAPASCGQDTAWLGAPPLELPRLPAGTDPALTTDPPARLIAARAMMEAIRILLPATLSTVIGSLAFWGLNTAGNDAGVGAMMGAAVPLLLAGGIAAMLATVALKWLLIGRYRAGEHPLWSWFVWRDEIINSAQEELAGSWLLDFALGTPLMSLYLRLMGSKVGRDVWCETLTITEFELASLGDGAAVNRHSVVETHLFHDRMMRIGPASLGAGSTLGPSSATLPDTEIGEGCMVGGRAVVMRGERLPAQTSWHGAPVVAL